MDTTTTDQDRRIAELEAQVARLTEVLAPTPAPAVPGRDATAPRSSTRRGMLKLAGAAVAGATAAAVGGRALPAAAASDPILAGTQTAVPKVNEVIPSTVLIDVFEAIVASTAATPFSPPDADVAGALIGWDLSEQNFFDTTMRAGVLGYGDGGAGGVLGLVEGAGNARAGVTAISASGSLLSAGLLVSSKLGPTIQMTPTLATRPAVGLWQRGALLPTTDGGLWFCYEAGTPGSWVDLASAEPAYDSIELTPQGDGQPTTGTWNTGTLLSDRSGVLWYCLTGGSPGKWVDVLGILNDPGITPPSLIPLSPRRLHDSRVEGGPLAAGASRTIAVRDALVVGSTTVEQADYVPSGASALTANITVVDTVGSGFLAVNPKGDTTVHAATVNWFASGQILNNGVTITLGGDRELTVIAGGSAGSSTDFVIDVTAYLF